jgi:hypothetical protein
MKHTPDSFRPALPAVSRLLAVTALVACAMPALAGRPLASEDAGVLDRGDCELEGAAAHASVSGASGSERALQLGCGIGFDTQLALGLARASAGGAHADGLALGGKTSLWKGSEDAGLALAYSLAWGRAGGGSWEHAETALNLAYSRPTSKELTLHANLGHARDEIGGAAATTWSLALEHAGFGALAPMAEVFGDDREGPWWNLDLRWTVADEKFYIDASYGRQMASGRARLVTLGFKFAF